MKERAIIIFIKNPIKGKVKTRLAASVGDDKALAIYQALLTHTRMLTSKTNAQKHLFYSNYLDQHDDWSENIFHKNVQQGDDLGDRMFNAFNKVLTNHESAVIIGSDCASLTLDILNNAFQQLESKDFVIGPAQDGGYYLLGMKQAEKSVFENIEWSTEEVLPKTLSRIKTLGKSVAMLPTLSDIDYVEDWEKYGWEI